MLLSGTRETLVVREHGIVTPELSAEIRAALAAHGFAPERAALLSPLGANKGRRCAYRVEDAAGRVVKAREFENQDEARRVFELRSGLEDAFAPALARHGAVLLEEWIEGEALAERDWDAWAEPAGALLGRLHSRPLGADQPATMSTERWVAGAEADLELLGAVGRLASVELGRLRDEIRRRDPGSSATALVHTDFCADNMLIDIDGRLRIVDNEGLAVRPPGLDLGRTFHLWPMPARIWARFRRGYRSVANDPGASGFWRIVATLVGARVFLRLDPLRHEASLALLRRFLAGEQLSDGDP